jgi:hypothetical protein
LQATDRQDAIVAIAKENLKPIYFGQLMLHTPYVLLSCGISNAPERSIQLRMGLSFATEKRHLCLDIR